MKVFNFEIPIEIQCMLDAGIWPQSESQLRKQEMNPIIFGDVVSQIAPEMEKINFEPPPFASIQQMLNEGDDFWHQEGIEAIDLSKSILIGDFGIGTDTALILYYDKSDSNPSVYRLEWYGDDQSNPNIINKVRWVRVADSFSDFCTMVGLSEVIREKTE